MTPDELAAIVARDAAVKFVDVTPTQTRVDTASDDDRLRAIQDRRALLGLLRETREALTPLLDLHTMTLGEYRRKYGPRDDAAEGRREQAALAAMIALEPLRAEP